MRSQSVTGKKYVQITSSNHLANVLNAPGVDHGRAQDGEDFLPRLMRSTHGGGNFADGNPLGFLAGNGARHEFEEIMPRRRFSRKDPQSLAPDDDPISLPYLGHRQATGRAPLRIKENAAVHFHVLNIDPFPIDANLGAVAGRAVEAFRKGPVHIRFGERAILGGDRCGPVVMDRVEDFLQDRLARRPDLNAGETGVFPTLAHPDLFDLVSAAAREDFVEHLGQEQRINNVPLDLHFLNMAHRRWGGRLCDAHARILLDRMPFSGERLALRARWRLAAKLLGLLSLFYRVLSVPGTPCTEDVQEHLLGGVRQSAFLNCPESVLNGILNAFELYFVVFDHGIGSARVAVARLPNASGVDDEFVADFEDVRVMGVAHANDVRIDILQAPAPDLRIGGSVLVQRVTRGGVDEKKARVLQSQHA